MRAGPSTMIRRAFEIISDIPTRLICFSDDLDGMRKVPDNVPNTAMLREHLQSYLALRDESPDVEPLPAYAERTFRGYLKCGIPAHGVALARCPSCGLAFVVAFSCKTRGLCPSCEARHRAETAAHLVDHVIPRVPVRHWVLSLPRRVRYLCRDRPALASGVLRVFLRAVEGELRRRSPGAPREARFGAVAFEHRAGSFLNDNFHFHVPVTDGVFAADGEGGAAFFEASELDEARVAALQERVRQRVLRFLVRRGALDVAAAAEMQGWEHGGGFSLDASRRVEAWDRQGLERLCRYCARPALSLARLDRVDEETLIYRFPHPDPRGRESLVLTPFELIERLARLLPPPFRNRIHYYGVLAGNAKLRRAVIATAGPSAALQLQLAEAAQQMGLAEPEPATESEARPQPGTGNQEPGTRAAGARRPSLARYCWALLLARLYEALPLVCSRCGSPMKIVAFVTEPDSLRPLLLHVGEPTEPLPLRPARGPPQGRLAFASGTRGVQQPALDEEDVDQSAGLSDDDWA